MTNPNIPHGVKNLCYKLVQYLLCCDAQTYRTIYTLQMATYKCLKIQVPKGGFTVIGRNILGSPQKTFSKLLRPFSTAWYSVPCTLSVNLWKDFREKFANCLQKSFLCTKYKLAWLVTLNLSSYSFLQSSVHSIFFHPHF